MALFTIYKWQRRIAKSKNILELHTIKFLNGSEKVFWSFERMVVDPIEKIGYDITKYTKCGYGLHFFHNICIICGDIINMIWGEAYEQTMQMEALCFLG